MTVLLLRKTAFIIFFCNIVITNQDFLEHYKPRPSLPEPLNEWLTYVQKHKTDFKFINNIVKRRKEEQEYYDEIETTNRNRLLESNEDEYIDEVPQNDIYPHQRQEKEENAYKNFGTTFTKHKNIKKRSKSNRIRRDSSKHSFFEHTNNLQVESNGKLGEIKRVGEKYPEQLKNKDLQRKREIQIDVLNNGKLVKSIREAGKDSKSILLNIDTIQEPNSQLIENKIAVKKSDIKDLYMPLQAYPLQNTLESDTTKQTIMDAEKAINYNNLFTVNKDLNTDSSVSKNILMYHVTVANNDLPILDTTAPENVPAHNFHQNNFKDMSKYWSDSEKHQLRKGIQFAHDTTNIKHMIKDIPKPNLLTDGFEAVKSIVVNHSRDTKPSKEKQQQYQPQVKRNLDTLQGTVKLQNEENVVDIESSMIPLGVTVTNNLLKELLSTEAHREGISKKSQNIGEVKKEVKECEPSGDNMNQELFHHHNNELPNAANVHHADENINNHIDITIIQPQKEKNNEDFEKQEDSNKVGEQELKEEMTEENNNNEELKNELVKEIIREEDKNKAGEEEHKEEMAEENNNIEELKNELVKEIIREEEIEEEKGHKHNELEDKRIEEQREPEHMNPECNQEDETHIKYIIGEHSKEHTKGPRVKIQVDVSKDIHNEDKAKKRNLINKRNIHNRHRNKRPFHCRGNNCDTQFNDLKINGHTKDNLPNRQHVHLNKKKFHSYNSRQLKSANYIYDVDIEAPNDEEYAEDDISSEKNQLSGINKKDAVEGDYGDEEDSLTINKKDSNKIVKLSKNAFANPRTVSTHEDDDDSDYYDEEAPTTKNKNHTKKAIHEHTVKYRSREHTSEFGKHLHKKPKVIIKSKKGYEDSFENVREPRSQGSFEDFQQLPKFVMNDRIEEENLRKRSMSTKKEFAPNKFPLSSIGFFTKDTKQNGVKRSETIGDSILDKSSAAPIVYSATVVVDNVVSNTGYNGENNGTTLVDFRDLPAINFTTTVPPSTECEDSKVDIRHACEMETFNNNSKEITTLLSIIPEAESQMLDNGTDILKPNEKFEKLDEVLSGELPNSLVKTIYDHLKNDEHFKTRLFRGMKRFHEKLITSNDIQAVTQEENRKMLSIMETIINKLEWNSNCQMIPKSLRRYLTSITKGKTHDVLTKTKQMEEVNFDDTQNIRNFLFNHEGEGTPSAALTQKSKILKDMLNKFEQLPADCKARGEPVKKYIEEHLIMLDHVNDIIKSQTERIETVTEFKEATVQTHQKPKRRNGQIDDLVEEQLESLGLGKNHNFKPKFNLDDIVESSKNSIKRQQQEGKLEKKSKRELTNEGSEQYQRLLAAVNRERIKREGKRRLAETFGKLNVDDFTGENPDNPIKEIFESPVVYIS